jgi:hypothetical protein
MRFSDIVVSKHTVVEVDKEAQFVVATVEAGPWFSAAGSISPTLLALRHGDLGKLRSWSTDGVPIYKLASPSLPEDVNRHEVERALAALTTSQAFPWNACGFTSIGNDTVNAALLALEGLGFVKEMTAGVWQLTAAGMQAMQVCVKLTDPTLVLAPPTCVIPSATWSAYELIVHLERKGWSHSDWCLQSSGRRRWAELPGPYMLSGGEKTWYTKSIYNPLHGYLLVLALQCDQNFVRNLKDKCINEVQHFQPATYYAKLLQAGSEALPPISDESNAVTATWFDFEEDLVLQRAGRRRIKAFVLAESFAWGKVTFKYRPPRGKTPGRFQCDCPRRSHVIRKQTRGSRTVCSKTLPFRTDEEKESVIRRLKHWAASCDKFATKTLHQRFSGYLEGDALPDNSTLEAMKPPEDREATDTETAAVASSSMPTAMRRGGRFGRGRGNRSALAGPLEAESGSACHSSGSCGTSSSNGSSSTGSSGGTNGSSSDSDSD